jgi:TetR/AcrR family transcriptional repressor of nem operon
MAWEGSETRERILEAAARLFHEQGFNATGISTILREAKVQSGSLYYFFPSKESLLIGVLERYEGLLDPAVMEPAEMLEEDPIERIFVLLSRYRMGLELSGCTMGCPIGNLAIELADSHPEIREKIDKNFGLWKARIRQWLDSASLRLPKDLERDELATFILTVMEGAIMQARAASDLRPYDESVKHLRRYFDTILADRQKAIAYAFQNKSGAP